jgi:dTDP-4-amino-4,6-dideoxygalactose transaminase
LIPQTSPQAAYRTHRSSIDAAIGRVMTSDQYILGREVAAFEAEYAAWIGGGHAVGVGNGTDALVLGLMALGIEVGDIVATAAHTAVATIAAILLAGATPALVDIDNGYGLDPSELHELSQRHRIRAVIPVHLYGQPVDLDGVLTLAEGASMAVLEDASQAHGARYGDRMVGRFGAAAAFSLYPTKNLGAIGDGGVLTTDDADLNSRLRALREYGWDRHRVSQTVGMNSRLDELQAAILRAKLPLLDAENARRRDIAAAYDEGLAGIDGLERPWRRPGTQHVFHQYVVRHRQRDALRSALLQDGVATGIHYPLPAHRHPAYRDRVILPVGGVPTTERAAATVLSLPMFPQLEDGEVDAVIRALRHHCACL